MEQKTETMKILKWIRLTSQLAFKFFDVSPKVQSDHAKKILSDSTKRKRIIEALNTREYKKANLKRL
jgi:hypothetical protein